MAEKDYYKILGVRRDAKQKEIQQAYHKLVRDYHPDLHPGDKQMEEKFKEINEAYQTLNNPQKRKEYDEMQRIGGGPTAAPPHPQGSRRQAQAPSSSASAPSKDIFSVLLNQMRHQAASNVAGASASPSRDSPATSSRQDYEVELRLTPEEIREGTVKRIRVEDKSVQVLIPPGVRLPFLIRVRRQ